MFLIECGLVALAVLAAVAVPIEKWPYLDSSMRGLERRFSRLAQKRGRTAIVAALGPEEPEELDEPEEEVPEEVVVVVVEPPPNGLPLI
jgi:hypothetical protein